VAFYCIIWSECCLSWGMWLAFISGQLHCDFCVWVVEWQTILKWLKTSLLRL